MFADFIGPRKIVSMTSVVLGLWAVAPQAHAKGIESGSDLVTECRKSGADEVRMCASYINGFVHGAEAVNKAIDPEVRDKHESRSAYLKRVYEGRASNRLGGVYGDIYDHYCIPSDEGVQSIISKFNNYAESNSPAPEQLAKEFLYSALTAIYPCKNDSQ